MTPMVDDPLCRVEWLDAATLNANDYNPNVVFNKELALLERSLLLTGWVQPILVSRDRIIIDGFHRWRLSQDSPAMRARYGGRCPCVVLDVDRAMAMVMTVRMNRAKGSHVALRMADMVKELVTELGMDPKALADEIGATKDEIDLLLKEDVFAARDIKNYRYGRAWYPAETEHEGEAA